MSNSTINGKATDEILLEKLNSTIERNNELTFEQNGKLVKYTRWLFLLTMLIGCTTLLQLVAMLFLQ